MSALSLAPATAEPGWPAAVRTATAAPRRVEPPAPEFGLALCVAGPASPAELAALAELRQAALALLHRLDARLSSLLRGNQSP
jgi:hypothetical protein